MTACPPTGAPYDEAVTAPKHRESVGPDALAQPERVPGIQAIAFYLPQYFPIPENDEWWGPGFTEWTNAARARPLFPGHAQPTLPGELGFYDLRVAETRQAQSDLARSYGVAAFAYWHYWFGHGTRILERPFQEVLAAGRPEIPFCLAWANQTWSGVWHGARDRVLMQQLYPGAEDDQAHFDTLLPAFHDERYLRVGDRPVFYVFRPEELPDAAAFVDSWQGMARAAGLPGLYLVAEMSDYHGNIRYATGQADGFDASVLLKLPAVRSRAAILRMRVLRKLRGGPEVYPYDADALRGVRLDPHVQPSVYPNWDNTPRSGRGGLVLTGSEPAKFQRNVASAVRLLAERPEGERLLWIKSWNEWAEGNHLEPDLVHGRAWLEALRQGLRGD